MTARIDALTTLHAHLGYFNADTAGEMNAYWKDTGLGKQLLSAMSKVYKELCNRSDEELNGKFTLLTSDLRTFVAEQLKGSTSSPLWFEIAEVAKLEFDKAVSFVNEDIKSSSLERKVKAQLLEAFKRKDYTAILTIAKNYGY